MTRLWHAALALVIAAAMFAQLVLNIRNDASLVNFFSYFTVQSNLLVMVGAIGVALDPHRHGRWFGVLRLAGLAGITVTGLVYATVLAGAVELHGAARVTDILFHYVSPLMAVIGYLAFAPRTRLRTEHLAFLLWPMAWLAYTLVRGSQWRPEFVAAEGATSHYPYEFIDVDAVGAGQVAINCVAVTVLLLVLAWIYITVSRRTAGSDVAPAA